VWISYLVFHVKQDPGSTCAHELERQGEVFLSTRSTSVCPIAPVSQRIRALSETAPWWQAELSDPAGTGRNRALPH
jgi:hypothetical protein